MLQFLQCQTQRKRQKNNIKPLGHSSPSKYCIIFTLKLFKIVSVFTIPIALIFFFLEFILIKLLAPLLLYIAFSFITPPWYTLFHPVASPQSSFHLISYPPFYIVDHFFSPSTTFFILLPGYHTFLVFFFSGLASQCFQPHWPPDVREPQEWIFGLFFMYITPIVIP